MDENVKVLWDYLLINDKIEKVDCIFGLGSIDIGVAQRCAELYLNGYGDYIVFSGNCGKGTEGVISVTEAELFKQIAVQAGVPEDKIYLEKEATNTYENFLYSMKIIDENGLKCESMITVSKPYATRRVYQIAKLDMPNCKVIVTSSKQRREEYLTFCKSLGNFPEDDLINEIVGEISILQIAPKYKLQIKQEIPQNVIDSYKVLCEKGYTKYLITDEMVVSALDKFKALGAHID